MIFGVSGSVATIKAKEIAEELLKLNFNVVLLPTSKSIHFLNLPEYTIEPLLKSYPPTQDHHKPMFVQFLDSDEFQAWDQKDDPVLHVELRALASVLLIAPLGANTMAKICNGVCDNIVTQVTRAWHFESGSEVKYPFIVAPAMNTMMYEHPITEI